MKGNGAVQLVYSSSNANVHEPGCPSRHQSDSLFAYGAKRAALGANVAQVWGWDETTQRTYHAASWAGHQPDVIELDGVPIGTLAVVEHSDHLYVGEFYLLPGPTTRSRDPASEENP